MKRKNIKVGDKLVVKSKSDWDVAGELVIVDTLEPLDYAGSYDVRVLLEGATLWVDSADLRKPRLGELK